LRFEKEKAAKGKTRFGTITKQELAEMEDDDQIIDMFL
jgi:hypothetical protein